LIMVLFSSLARADRIAVHVRSATPYVSTAEIDLPLKVMTETHFSQL